MSHVVNTLDSTALKCFFFYSPSHESQLDVLQRRQQEVLQDMSKFKADALVSCIMYTIIPIKIPCKIWFCIPSTLTVSTR